MDRRMDRRTLAKGAVAVASAAALGLFQTSAEASGAPETTRTRPSLYDRLGGYFGIALVVNRFSDQILKNPILNKNRALKAWNKTEAEARRMARFWAHGHTPGPMHVYPEPPNPAAPATLDLRWRPMRQGA